MNWSKIRAASGLNLRVVNNHVIKLDAGGPVLLRHATEGVEEKAVTKLHDVRLMNTGDFLC